VAAAGERLKTLADVETHTDFAFRAQVEVDPAARAEVLAKPGARERLAALAELAEKTEPFTTESLESGARSLAERLGVKPGELFFPARVALTGRKVSPGLFEVMHLLGRERTLERLRGALRWWEGGGAA
jgi:glutamyl/glutaminyl-tRNA synthetase